LLTPDYFSKKKEKEEKESSYPNSALSTPQLLIAPRTHSQELAAMRRTSRPRAKMVFSVEILPKPYFRPHYTTHLRQVAEVRALAYSKKRESGDMDSGAG
jgi:hypothetical protein